MMETLLIQHLSLENVMEMVLFIIITIYLLLNASTFVTINYK